MADLEIHEEDIIDDLIPNEGGSSIFASEDQEQDRENREEASMVTGGGQLVDHILSWFDEGIAEGNKTTSLNIESKVPLESQVVAAQQYVAFLEAAKASLISLRDAHIK